MPFVGDVLQRRRRLHDRQRVVDNLQTFKNFTVEATNVETGFLFMIPGLIALVAGNAMVVDDPLGGAILAVSLMLSVDRQCLVVARDSIGACIALIQTAGGRADCIAWVLVSSLPAWCC